MLLLELRSSSQSERMLICIQPCRKKHPVGSSLLLTFSCRCVSVCSLLDSLSSNLRESYFGALETSFVFTCLSRCCWADPFEIFGAIAFFALARRNGPSGLGRSKCAERLRTSIDLRASSFDRRSPSFQPRPSTFEPRASTLELLTKLRTSNIFPGMAVCA